MSDKEKPTIIVQPPEIHIAESDVIRQLRDEVLELRTHEYHKKMRINALELLLDECFHVLSRNPNEKYHEDIMAKIALAIGRPFKRDTASEETD